MEQCLSRGAAQVWGPAMPRVVGRTCTWYARCGDRSAVGTNQCGPARHSDSYRPMTPPATPLTLERRLALLREISEGRNTLHAGPSEAAQAVLAAKLAEWQQLVTANDIRVRTLHEITVAGEELLLAAAALTTSGLKFLEEHGGERGERG